MISILAAFFSFSFVDLAAFEHDSGGAKAFYGIWLSALYAVFPGVYATMAPGILSTFGPKFYSSNYGLVYTQNVRNLLKFDRKEIPSDLVLQTFVYLTMHLFHFS